MIEYMEWLKFNRGYSDYSIRNYLTGLNQLDNYLKIVYGWGVEECEKIKIRYINDFVREQILIREMNPRTVNNYLAGIKLYFRFCLIQGKDVENYNKIMYVKEHRKKIDALSEVECVKLFEYFKNVKAVSREEELIKIRNLVLVSMFMYTGLRLAELVNLKSEDIAEDMQIEGKGGKMRYISIHPDDLKIIEYYLFLRKDNSEWLFVSHQKGKESKKLSKVSIEHIISEGAKNAGITVPVFPHKLRHTFATNLLRCNAPLPHIQQLLGHENISTTQIYLTVLNSEIKKTQNSIHRFG